MPFEYVSVDEAIARRGWRMVVVGGIPSPWGEAAKGILHIKGIDWTAVRLVYDSEPLKEWAGQRSGPWLVIVVDRDRAGALAGPVLERLAVVGEPHCGPIDALDVQDALGGFAPRARDAADHDHAPTPARDRLVDTYIFEGHQRTSTSSQKPIQWSTGFIASRGAS